MITAYIKSYKQVRFGKSIHSFGFLTNRNFFLKIHIETRLTNKSVEGSFMSIDGTDFKINELGPFDKS